MSTEIQFVDALAQASSRTDAIEQHVVSRLVAAGLAAGVAGAKNKFDLDGIADNVLDESTFEPVVDDEQFWRVVGRKRQDEPRGENPEFG